jgi:hypothetical protein
VPRLARRKPRYGAGLTMRGSGKWFCVEQCLIKVAEGSDMQQTAESLEWALQWALGLPPLG